MFVSNGLELKPHTSAARAWHSMLPMKIAKLIARIKLENEELFIRPRRPRNKIWSNEISTAIGTDIAQK
jgi:hypothetical protein